MKLDILIRKNIPSYVLLFMVASTLQGQTITNVQARQEGLTIIITYDMSGTLKSNNEIRVACTTDGGKSYIPISGAEGDVGSQVTPGTGKEIFLPVTDNTPTGKDLSFKVWAGIPPPDMIYVAEGSFQMGLSHSSSDSDEKPLHTVTVSSFFMDATEVTQAEYQLVMGKNPSNFSGCDECPVERVSWNDATEYANRVGKRLPTEAEWEYAARGGNQSRGFIYSGSSDDLGSIGWHKGNSGNKTHPVGQKKPNELGLYDMTGNVEEWCADWYAEDYYSRSPGVNPSGPASGSARVLRGTSLDFSGPWTSRIMNRYWAYPSIRRSYIGFRCVRDF